MNLNPVMVPPVETANRCIKTPIPVPESLPLLEKLRRYEPRALQVLAPVVWERAEGWRIFDPYGNSWIDFTSGIYVANTGHAHPDVRRALQAQIDQKLLHAYLFATDVRARLVEKLVQMTPASLSKVFLLSTGSEAIECSLKLARLHGLRTDPQKTILVSFTGAFHGKTMGAQMLASAPDHKSWIVNPDPDICQIPFPRHQCGGEFLEQSLQQLASQGQDPNRIAAFILESFQGVGGPVFYPEDYVQALGRWAGDHGALVIFDEIQAGYGRTGKFLAYEHYGVEADLVCCGKGMSSSLPLSAVLGRAEILDIPEPGQMTSTHTANPLCCAAALATLEILEREGLVEASARKGRIFQQGLENILGAHPDRINAIRGRGLVQAVFFNDHLENPDRELAERVTDKAIGKGLMLFHTHGDLVKMGPPLIISEEALKEGIAVLAESVAEALSEET